MTPHFPPLVRIGIADDHPIFRDGLRRLLDIEPGLTVVGEAANAEQASTLAFTHTPDVLLLDLAMPRVSGLEALRTTPELSRVTRVIVLTAAIEKADMVKALMLGARGVVLKESATAVLIEAIRTVVSGGYWVGREAVSDIVAALQDLQAGIGPRPTRDFGLTDRELEIVALIVHAAGNKEIAERLSISGKTVKNHLTNIFDKLGVSGRLELAMFAINNHLHPPK
jgi:two-component system, NarL family, nitrate/nitrite response regulator NarL